MYLNLYVRIKRQQGLQTTHTRLLTIVIITTSYLSSYATIAVAGVVHQDTDPELGPDLEVKLGEDLSEDQQCIQKDLIRRHLDVFTYMPRETNLLQHRVSLKGNTPKVNIKQEMQCTVVGRP